MVLIHSINGKMQTLIGAYESRTGAKLSANSSRFARLAIYAGSLLYLHELAKPVGSLFNGSEAVK